MCLSSLHVLILPPDNQILALQPMWRNFFENSATVQADHRVLALTTTAAALGMFWYARRGAAGGALWAALPKAPRVATTATAGLVAGQVRGIRVVSLFLSLVVILITTIRS